MSRADEIAQGLRHESGALTFPLNVLDYNQGYQDRKDGNPPPDISSDSYDLGRWRASDEIELQMEVDAYFEKQRESSMKAMRKALGHRPDLLAEYEAKIAAIYKAPA